MIPYILHSSILLAGCFLFYWLFIRKETFFRLNRWILISSVLLSVTIPLISVPESWSIRPDAVTKIIAPPVDQVDAPVSEEVDAASNNHVDIIDEKPEEAKSEKLIIANDTSVAIKDKTRVAKNWENFPIGKTLWYVYLIGVAVFLMAFLVQLFIIIAKMITLVSMKDGRFKIIELIKDEAPYSFWNTIFINPGKYDPDTYEQIINHEKIHIQQAHFVDKLIAEFLVILFWFNPFVWLFRKAITNNLEYLTDSSMLEKGVERRTYQMSLLRVSVPQYPLHLTTNYNSSFLKNRIAMMNAKKSSARSSWKYLFLLPLLGFSMICLNEVHSKKVELLSEMEQNQALQNPETEAASKAVEQQAQAVEQAVKKIEKSDLIVQTNPKTKTKLKTKVKTKSKTSTKTNSKINLTFNGNNLTNSNLRPGDWDGEIDGNKVCLQLNNSRPAQGYMSHQGKCFDKSEFSEIPMGADKDFYIKREAGTLNLNGSFEGEFGDGTFNYTPSAAFSSYLKSEGINIKKDRQEIHLFMNDINKNYIAYLKKEGFKIDGDDLFQLSVHAIDKDQVKDFVAMFKDLNYKDYKVRDLIQFKIHDVETDFVNELRGLGMTDLTVQDIVQASIHDVDPKYIQEIHEAGFSDMKFSDLVQFSIHDIDAEFIKGFKEAGLDNLSQQDIIQAGIHDVDVDFVKAMKAYGMDDLRMGDIVQLAIHDVDADYLQEMEAVGYPGLSREDVVQAKIHDVDPDYIREIKAQGLSDMDMGEIVQFAIHGIEIRDIKAFKAAGFEVDNQDIIQAGIHDVSARYIEKMKALGFNDEELEDFINAKIHGVNPSFIKRAREKGHNPKSLKEYVRLKIAGI